MPPAEEEARFALRLDADTEPAKDAAEALEKFRSAIEKSQDRIASYRKSMALLKGDSEDVTAAKKQLKAAIEAEKGAITKANLEILKLGSSYDKLQKASKKNTDATKAGGKAIKAFGGPLRDVSERFGMLKELLGGVTSGYGLLAIAVVAAVTGLAALAVGAGELVTKFTEWLAVSGDALRNMRLTREAVSGNEKNALAWGHAIDWLSLKVATSKDGLNALAVATEKSLRGTRVSGQGMVDTWSAVAQAGAAMGKDVGDALNEIITRGKLTGRFGINFIAPGISELQGKGITFQQVARNLAKDLNIGLDQAQRALVMHTVTLSAGARAVREAVEEQFGGINAKKLLSIDALATKFKDNLRDWASDAAQAGGALEPLLTLAKKLVDQFGLQSESGQRMKAVVRDYAEKLAAGLERNLPLMISIVQKTIEFASWLVQVGTALVSFATSSTGLFLIKGVLYGAAVAAGLLLVAMSPLIVAGAAIAAAFVGIGLAIATVVDAVKKAFTIDWGFLGDQIVKGITGGLLRNVGELKSAVKGLATSIWNTFTGKDGIDAHSPSRKFAKAGRWSVEGYAGGVRGSADVASNAVSTMATSSADAAAPASSRSSGPPAEIKIEFNIQGSNAQEIGETLRSQSLLDGLQFAVRSALKAAGIPTGAPVMAGG